MLSFMALIVMKYHTRPFGEGHFQKVIYGLANVWVFISCVLPQLLVIQQVVIIGFQFRSVSNRDFAYNPFRPVNNMFSLS